jgi:hypothetical protein
MVRSFVGLAAAWSRFHLAKQARMVAQDWARIHRADWLICPGSFWLLVSSLERKSF